MRSEWSHYYTYVEFMGVKREQVVELYTGAHLVFGEEGGRDLEPMPFKIEKSYDIYEANDNLPHRYRMITRIELILPSITHGGHMIKKSLHIRRTLVTIVKRGVSFGVTGEFEIEGPSYRDLENKYFKRWLVWARGRAQTRRRMREEVLPELLEVWYSPENENYKLLVEGWK